MVILQVLLVHQQLKSWLNVTGVSASTWTAIIARESKWSSKCLHNHQVLQVYSKLCQVGVKPNTVDQQINAAVKHTKRKV